MISNVYMYTLCASLGRQVSSAQYFSFMGGGPYKPLSIDRSCLLKGSSGCHLGKKFQRPGCRSWLRDGKGLAECVGAFGEINPGLS